MRSSQRAAAHGATRHAWTTPSHLWPTARPDMRATATVSVHQAGLPSLPPKLRDRQLRAVRPVMRDTPANCARPNMRDVPIPGMTARGLPRPFMRMLNSLSVLASRGGRAGATSYARSTRWSRPVPHPPITPLAATGYACTTMRSDQRKHLPRLSMRGQHAGRHADVPGSACPAQ